MPLDLSKDKILGEKYKAADKVIIRKGLGDVRAAVYIVIDVSGSMGRFYQRGTVQNLGEQALALSGRFDDDGKVPFVAFDSWASDPVDMHVTQAEGAIQRAMNGRRLGGGTDYAAAMRKVIDAHAKSDNPSSPAFVIFQTDGADGNPAATTRLLCESSELPIFWQFVGFGKDVGENSREYDEFAFLRSLDTITVAASSADYRRGVNRVVDNAGFFPAGEYPENLSDEELYDGLMNEFPQYLQAARAAGIIR